MHALRFLSQHFVIFALAFYTEHAFASLPCQSIFTNVHQGKRNAGYWNGSPFRGSREKNTPRSLEEILSYAKTEFNVSPVFGKATVVKSNRQDVPFDDFYFRGIQRFADLKPESKTAQELLFRGTETRSMNEAETLIEQMFSSGWSAPQQTHRNIELHVRDSEGSRNSGFLSTTANSRVAGYFCGSGPFGVIFLISSRGAEVLNVSQYLQHINAHENEVLFSDHLSPH